MLLALCALAFCVLIGLLVRVWVKGGVVTGADGYLVVDPLQYLNWLRQAGDHGLVRNLYDIGPSPRSFLHPGVLLAGLAHRAGLGLVASYMLFKPVAIAALFAGALLFTRRFLQHQADRRFALVLALFACSPVAALVGWANLGSEFRQFQFDLITGELWTGSYLWGYLFTAIAVGVMPLGLLAYQRGRGVGRRALGVGGQRRCIALAAAAGLIAGWLQPWQGATFAGILVAGEVMLFVATRQRPPLLRLAIVLAATAAPLVYYLALSRLDDAWKLAGTANAASSFGGRAWPAVIFGVAIFAVPAAFAYRRVPRDFASLALRAWPPLALAVYVLPFGTFPYHALQGLTLPLVVLGVLAWRQHLGERPLALWPAVAVAALLIVPGTAYRIDNMRKAVAVGRQPHFLTDGEHDALDALSRDPERGGVLAPVYMGLLVPAYTGRETWIGAGSWTPDFTARQRQAEDLFAGRLSPARARALVRRSHARFLLSDCHGRADIAPTVAAFTDPPKRYGCATVWRVRG
ncbi:MAG: hypothetical protein ACJ77L_05290 [Solirubrobacteraceae bacterium]